MRLTLYRTARLRDETDVVAQALRAGADHRAEREDIGFERSEDSGVGIPGAGVHRANQSLARCQRSRDIGGGARVATARAELAEPSLELEPQRILVPSELLLVRIDDCRGPIHGDAEEHPQEHQPSEGQQRAAQPGHTHRYRIAALMPANTRGASALGSPTPMWNAIPLHAVLSLMASPYVECAGLVK